MNVNEKLSQDKEIVERGLHKALSQNQQKLFGSRVKFCFAYVQSKKGNCNGYRHKLLFILSTAAVPLYGSEVAKNRMRCLAGQFVDDSSISEKYISSTVERMLRREYKLKNKTICEWLNITQNEYQRLALSNMEVEKRKNKKIETKKKREERDTIIIAAINNGKTRREAAELAGCSLRTVNYVVRSFRNTCRD